MTSTTQRFVWKDRDTAARDMLQLAYHAPPHISSLALNLLKAFRSTAIVPELKQLVLDESRDVWERRYALEVLACTPGDIDFPEMARFATLDTALRDPSNAGEGIGFDDCAMLAKAHPSNLSWLFTSIEREPLPIYLKALRVLSFEKGWSYREKLSAIVFERIRFVYDANPYLFEMEQLRMLCSLADMDMLDWLEQHHDLIVYICQGNYAPTVSEQLRRWIGARRDEMNGIIDWWTPYQCRTVPYKPRCELEVKTTSNNPLWIELNSWYEAALAGSKRAFIELHKAAYHEQSNLPRRADAIRFLGKLKDRYDVRDPLLRAVRYGPEDLAYQVGNTKTNPIRYEAGKALSSIASPDVWETLVDAYFINPESNLQWMLRNSIMHLTDRLSGVEEPSPVPASWDEERPWLPDMDVAPAPVEATDSV